MQYTQTYLCRWAWCGIPDDTASFNSYHSPHPPRLSMQASSIHWNKQRRVRSLSTILLSSVQNNERKTTKIPNPLFLSVTWSHTCLTSTVLWYNPQINRPDGLDTHMFMTFVHTTTPHQIFVKMTRLYVDHTRWHLKCQKNTHQPFLMTTNTPWKPCKHKKDNNRF